MTSASASASSTALPSGITAPLELDDATHHGALIAVSAATSLGLVLISMPIRIWVRLRAHSYKLDDYAFLGASLFSCIQATTVFIALSYGFGTSDELLLSENITPMLKALYASDIFYITTLFLSKACTALLFLRLTPGKGHFIASLSTLILLLVWVLSSVIILAIKCHPTHPWTDILSASSCSDLFLRWQVIGAIDIITELFLFAIAIYLIWGLQMSFKSKSTVVGAFAFRLPLIPLAALHLHFTSKTITSTNPTFTAGISSSLTSFQIGYSILASIIPCLKPFMAPYEGPPIHTTANTGGGLSGYKGSKNSYKLSSISNGAAHERIRDFEGDNDGKKGLVVERRNGNGNRNGNGDREGEFIGEGGGGTSGGVGNGGIVKKLKLRPDRTTEYEARIGSGITGSERGSERGNRGGSFDSGDSRRMIIKKNVEWSVDVREDDGRVGSGTRDDDVGIAQ